MRIVQLTAGTGSFYCGNCIRDTTLVKAHRARGHDAIIVPLYLPIVSEVLDHQSYTTPLFYGGINVYLQHRFVIFRKTPRWIDAMFDWSWFLKKASKKTHMTKASDLGELTVATLKGEGGPLNKELQRLIDWLKQEEKPDVINLSNILLVGLAPTLHQQLNVPVTCTLHGEDAFLNSLPEPHKSTAWNLIKEKAKSLAAILSVSNFYREVMAPLLGRSVDSIDVVHNGIDLAGFKPNNQVPEEVTWGYLAKMSPEKGLTTLVDAFIILKQQSQHTRVKLAIAGVATEGDEPYVDSLKTKLLEAKVDQDVRWFPNVDHEKKREFLRSLSLFSVPATYGEAFGLYLIEAAASGIPILQPHHGAFPGVLDKLGQGTLCEPNSPKALAEIASELLSNREQALTQARASCSTVHKYFSDGAMAERVEAVYQRIIQ
jgi:glycosyltransferase involved in cell wall biosynthesis